MKCRCDCYDWRYDPVARQFVVGLLEAALTTEYLVFRKTEWIPDCGFSIMEKEIEIPRGFDGKGAKIRCFTECLALLNKGWQNEIADRNREMMERYLYVHPEGAP